MWDLDFFLIVFTPNTSLPSLRRTKKLNLHVPYEDLEGKHEDMKGDNGSMVGGSNKDDDYLEYNPFSCN